MKLSYLGIGNYAEIISNIFRKSCSKFRLDHPHETSPFTMGGVYAGDVSAVTKFAARNDMAVYFTADELFYKSDVIFVFTNDKSVSSLASSLYGHDIKNKIICHFSSAYDADVLDFGPFNTYISFYMAAIPTGDDTSGVPINLFYDGYGDRFNEFADSMTAAGINHVHITREQKGILSCAGSLINDLPSVAEKISERLISLCFSDNPDIAEEMVKYYRNGKIKYNSYNPIKNANLDYAALQTDVIKALGFDDISAFVGSFYITQANMSSMDNPVRVRMDELGRKLLGK